MGTNEEAVDGPLDRVVIRSYPKIVYFYPTIVASIIAALWSWSKVGVGCNLSDVPLGPGRLFFVIFAFNMLILAFDFSRKGFLAVILTVAIFLLAGALIEVRFPFFEPIERFLGFFDLRAHPHVYLAVAFTLLVIIGIVIVSVRYTFWEIRANEVIHYQGFWADVDRYPAPGLKFKKQIPDVFEYALLRAGTIVLQPQVGEKQVIENVPGVNGVEERLERLLGAVQVRIQQGPPPAAGALGS